MATYYFSTSGNDSTGDGSQGNPWKSYNKAQAMQGAGVTLAFKGGDIWYDPDPYVNSITISSSNLALTSYGTGLPKFCGYYQTPITVWSGPDGNGVYNTSVSTCAELFEDGKSLGVADTGASIPNYNTGGDRRYWYLSSGTLYYKPSSGVPGDHTVQYSRSRTYLAMVPGIQYISINNIDLRYGAIAMDVTSGSLTIDYVTIDGVAFNEGSLFSCEMYGSTGVDASVTIQNCTGDYPCGKTFYFNRASSIFLNTLTFKDNTILHANMTQFGGEYMHPTDEFNDSDILYTQSIVNLYVEGNELSGNCFGDAAIKAWIGHSYYNCSGYIRNNYIHDVPCAGIFVENATGADYDIYDNIIINSSYQTSPVNRYAPSKLAAIVTTGASPTSTPILLANNTIRTCGIGIWVAASSDYYYVQNNVVDDWATSPAKSDVALGNNVWSNNDYNGAGSGSVFDYNGAAKTFAQWAAIFGENGSITTNPLFTNAGGSYALATDFKLQPGSPCINAGVDVGLTEDYGGNPIVGTPDIGAWEYQANYSRGDYAALPGTDADLENIYTPTEMSNVATDDEIYTDQTATSEYAVHEFKQIADISDISANITCDFQSTIAPSESPIVLEVYDQNASSWVEVARKDTGLANTDYTLTFTLDSGSSPTFDNAKDVNRNISCRVWQLAV